MIPNFLVRKVSIFLLAIPKFLYFQFSMLLLSIFRILIYNLFIFNSSWKLIELKIFRWKSLSILPKIIPDRQNEVRMIPIEKKDLTNTRNDRAQTYDPPKERGVASCNFITCLHFHLQEDPPNKWVISFICMQLEIHSFVQYFLKLFYVHINHNRVFNTVYFIIQHHTFKPTV